jgi:hypothetical protein
MTYRKGRCIRESRGLGLWCLAPLSTIFQLLSWPSVLLVEVIEESQDLPQVTDKLTTDSYNDNNADLSFSRNQFLFFSLNCRNITFI